MSDREEILDLMRAAGFARVQRDSQYNIERVERLVRLAQDAAYERAAVTAWMWYMDTCKKNRVNPAEHGEWLCADAIRALHWL